MQSIVAGNDWIISCPITVNGESINAEGLDSAKYALYSRGRVVIFEKSLGSGITGTGNTVNTEINPEDTQDLRGSYYHELTIVDPQKGKLTAFKGHLTIESSEN